MALPRLKTAVFVKDLVRAIERQRDREIEDAKSAETKFEKDMAAYHVAFEKHVRDRAEAIQKLVAAKVTQVKPGFDFPKRRHGYEFDSAFDWLLDGAKSDVPMPTKPHKPSGVKCAATKYDSLIAQLKLSAEEKIRLTPEDFAKFMAGDSAACAC